MKRIYWLLTIALLVRTAQAGLITHSDYTSGSAVTAAGQNTNENLIFNEFNGSIDNTNIKTGGITTTNILDGTIALGDLATTLQSTFTIVNTFPVYRKSYLKWGGSTSVSIGENTATANRTCIMFPLEQRCVTEDIASTSVNRLAFTNETASFSGTKNSGMAPGETVASNTWYSVWAVLVQDNSTDFVLAISTLGPNRTDVTALNSVFGTNGFTYLGLIRVGDSHSTSTGILRFIQSGPITTLRNQNGAGTCGITLSSTTAATVSWTYTNGSAGRVVPQQIRIGSIIGTGPVNGTATALYSLQGLTSSIIYMTLPPMSAGATISYLMISHVDLTDGILIDDANGASGSKLYSLSLTSWVDDALSSGVFAGNYAQQ